MLCAWEIQCSNLLKVHIHTSNVKSVLSENLGGILGAHPMWLFNIKWMLT